MKGQNFRVKIGSKCVAFATSCTVHAALQMEESSTKDDTDDYGKSEPVGTNWDFSCDALYSVETDSTGQNGESLMDILLAQTKVFVSFELTEGVKNRETVSGSNTYGGYAYINDISVNAANRQNVTYTIQGTGYGELGKNKIPGPSSSNL